MLLKEISYYRTGGSFDTIVKPASTAELSEAMADIESRNTPYFLLGAGSNSLVMDDHWPGTVIVFSEMQGLSVDGDCVVAQAGVDNTQFAEFCLEHSLSGASWMNWLPGRLGSTVRMNARCYGGEMSQIVESLSSVSPSGQIKTIEGSDALLGYKETCFMNNDEAISEIRFKLSAGDRSQIRRHMDFCRTDREKKQQFLYPSCGCVFKNDYTVGIPSGLLLDKAGVRKLSSERVEISPYHANFLFNKGATSRELLQTALDMRDLTYDVFGVWLEFELEILGVIPDDLQQRLNLQEPPRYSEEELKPLRKQFQQKLS
mgnify:CR=1 FL=1